MYVTRPRSLFRQFPGASSVQAPPDAPFSGQLVVTDEESEAMDSFCFGICNNDRIKKLPFPSDRILQVVHSLHEEAAYVTKVWFVPVLDQPISSNRYYVIKAKGHHKGRAYVCTKEGDIGTCCCTPTPRMVDKKTRLFDHRDRYQQFEIRPYPNGGFFAKSVEWDGHPPSFLRKGGWEVRVSESVRIQLREAPALRESPSPDAPDLNFPLHSRRSTPIVLGKWYCPSIFIREGNVTLGDQMRKTLFYEMSLKLWWERIYSGENEKNQSGVDVDVRMKKLVCLVHGVEGEKDERQDVDGFVVYKGKEEYFKKDRRVGLSRAVQEKMKWVQETRGWFEGERFVRVLGRKEIGGKGNDEYSGWRKFGCYVLVESFVLRRMDGGLLINFNFKNTDKIACKWE